MTDMPSTWFLLLNNRHERAFSFLEGMMNEFYHILIRKADIIPTKSISLYIHQYLIERNMSCVLEAWKVKAFYIGMLCKIVSKLVNCSMVFQLCKQHGSIETLIHNY